MSDFRRLLDLPGLLRRKSFFLFGPRATGKSFLVESQLKDRALVVDLLRSDLYLRLAADPSLLEALVGNRRGPGAVRGEGRPVGGYLLESDPRFLRRVQRARAQLRAGRGVRLEDVGP